MTSVPPEAEEAARSIASSHFLVSQREVDVLASDSQFAISSYLTEEVEAHLDTLKPDLREVGAESICDDALDQNAVDAYRGAYTALAYLTNINQRYAELALGREVETPDFKKMLEMVAAEQEGEEL